MDTAMIDGLPSLDDNEPWLLDDGSLYSAALQGEATIEASGVSPLPDLFSVGDPLALDPTSAYHPTDTALDVSPSQQSTSPTPTDTTTTSAKERNREYQARHRQRVKAERQQFAQTMAELKAVQARLASTEDQLRAANEVISRSGIGSIDAEVNALTDEELVYRTEDPYEQSFFSHIQQLVEQLSSAEPVSTVLMGHVSELHALVQYFEERLDPQFKVSTAPPQVYSYWAEVHAVMASPTQEMRQLTAQLKQTRVANLRLGYRTQARLSRQLSELSHQFRVIERGHEFKALLGELLANMEKALWSPPTTHRRAHSVTGPLEHVVGTATIPDPSEPCKLKVKFPPSPFPGPLNIIKTDYTSYANVASCAGIPIVLGRALWFLSRTPTMDPALKKELFTYMTGLGFTQDDLVRVVQGGACNYTTDAIAGEREGRQLSSSCATSLQAMRSINKFPLVPRT